MAKRHLTDAALDDVEKQASHLVRALTALHDLARHHENGVSGETLAATVESMSTEMLQRAEAILNTAADSGLEVVRA